MQFDVSTELGFHYKGITQIKKGNLKLSFFEGAGLNQLTTVDNFFFSFSEIKIFGFKYRISCAS